MHRNKFCLFFSLFIFISNLNAQLYLFDHKIYGLEDGLPSTELHDIVQDKKGYLWISSDNGLIKFDGYEFKVYGKSKGLKDAVVFDLQIGPDEKLWMNTLTKGIFYLDPEKDSIFEFLPLLKLKNEEFKRKNIFHVEKNGDIIFLTSKNQVYKATNNNIVNLSCSSDSISCLSLGIDMNGNLFKHEKKGKFLNLIWNFPNSISCSLLNNSKYDYQLSYLTLPNQDFVSFWNNGFIIASKNNKVLFQKKMGFDHIRFNQDKTIIAGNTNKKSGIFIFENNDEFYNYLYRGKTANIVNINDFLSSNTLIDNFHNIWVTTLDKGLIKFHDTKKYLTAQNNAITKYKLSLRVGDSIILCDEKNKYFYYNVINSQFAECKNLSNANIKKMYVGQNKKIYAIDDENKLYSGYSILKPVVNPVTKKQIISTKFYFANNKILSYATDYSYVYLKKIKNKKECKILFPARINGSLLSMENEYLFSTNKGIFSLDSSHCGILPFPKNQNISNQINFRIDFLQQMQNGIFVASPKNDSIYLFNNEFISKFKLDPLDSKNEAIKGIKTFENEIWVLKSNSLFYFKVIHEKASNIIKINHGLGFPLSKVIDFYIDQNQIIFITEKGIKLLNKSLINSQTTKTIEPFIEEIKIRNNVISFRNDMKFSYLENDITFKILAIDFAQNGKVRYQYSFDGEKYIDLYENRIVNFFKLKSGQYKFYFRANNVYNNWSKPSIFSFEILPPWWQTKWFYFIVFSLTICSIIWYFRRREMLLLREKSIKEEMMNLERAALQSQMNPHFIFNSLNSIQKFIINNEKEEASEYLAKFARLIRFNLKSSTSKEISLKDELALLEIYIGLERIRFKNKFNVEVSNNLSVSPEQILIPPMLIQPVVENAILHGISDIQEKGLIKILYFNDDKKIYVKVTDNGKGLTNNQITKEQSDGSRITKRRLELLNNQSQSNYTLINDKDELGNVIGAVAQLEITFKVKN